MNGTPMLLAQMSKEVSTILIVIGGIFAFICLIVFFKYGLLWIQAMVSGARVGMVEMVAMASPSSSSGKLSG